MVEAATKRVPMMETNDGVGPLQMLLGCMLMIMKL